MHTAARLLVVAAAIVPLAWGGVSAVQRLRADRHIAAATTEMRTWTSGAPQAGTWQSVKEQLETASALVPSDPTTRELLGLLGSLRSDDAKAMAEGGSHLMAALDLRPASPYTWANLVELKYRQGEPGANLQLAIQRAADLGPSEPGVQRILANYGLAVWDEIDPPTQAAVDRLVAAGFRRNPLEMLLISERRGRLDTACRHLAGTPRTPDPRLVTRCTGREATQ